MKMNEIKVEIMKIIYTSTPNTQNELKYIKLNLGLGKNIYK